MIDSLHSIRKSSGKAEGGGQRSAVTPTQLCPVDSLELRNVALTTWANRHTLERTETRSGDEARLVYFLENALRANLASGRYEIARGYWNGRRDDRHDLMRYANQILTVLESELDLIEGLKAGDRVRWAMVLKTLEARAERWFGRHSLSGCHDSAEVAGHTCMDLWAALCEKPYPFDVPFDHWSARALLNRMRQAVRDSLIRDQHITDSLDRTLGTSPGGPRVGEIIAERASLDWLDRVADRDALWQALACIQPLQAEVLVLLYLEEMPVKEVAARLGLNRNHVYQLRGRSLIALRDIWKSLL